MSTNITDFLAELDGGVFEQKLSRAVSEVAIGVVNEGKPGKVTITLDMKPIGNGHQVTIDHKLSFVRPTRKGRLSEDDSTQTPMHVGPQGRLTMFPENQNQLFDKHGHTKEEVNG